MKWTDSRILKTPIAVSIFLGLLFAALTLSVSAGGAGSGSERGWLAATGPGQAARPTREALERGRVIVESACSLCHELALVEEERLSREDWGYVIQAMLANGSDLSDTEIPFVLDYLATTYPAGAEDE